MGRFHRIALISARAGYGLALCITPAMQTSGFTRAGDAFRRGHTSGRIERTWDRFHAEKSWITYAEFAIA